MAAFLGIDAGTTSLKAALFDLDGHLLALDRQEYQLLTPVPDWVELDADTYWQACCRAVRNAVQQSGRRPEEIAALVISSQGETIIPLDATDVPVRRAIVWLDNRATSEAELIARQFDIEEIYHVTGQPEVTPMWPACKLLWLRRNEPEVFARAAKFLLVEDYLLYRLTGQAVTEYSLQPSSLMLDIQNKAWWAPMLDFIGVSADRLGHLMEPGEVVGPLSQAGAEALGLSTRTLAVSGAMDQMVGAVGAGNIIPDVVSETTGGALAIIVTLKEPRFDPQRRVPCYYHARRDSYCLQAWGQTGGMALRWFRDQFFGPEIQVARAAGLDPYDLMTRMAEQAPAGAEGLVVLPHLEGTACPEFNPAAKAVFYGATLRHGKAHFVRAIMESVAYMLKKNLDCIEQLGIGVREIRSLGGGARSDLWLQIKADVLQKPVTAVEVEEAACLGAALMAATAVGAFSSLEAGAARMVRLRPTIQPDPGQRAVYQQGYAQYLELYDRLAPMFH
jgi:xylulokinase